MENLSSPRSQKQTSSAFSELIEEDKTLDLTLRPKTWADFVGQEKLKKNLRIILTAAKERKEVPEHLLFYGNSGLGKTTISY